MKQHQPEHGCALRTYQSEHGCTWKEFHTKHAIEGHRHVVVVIFYLFVFTTTTTGPLLLCCRLHPAPSPLFSPIKPEITEDGNATVPIVEGVDGEEGGDLGVASAHQDNTAVRHRVTVVVEELSSHQHFFGDDMSITVIASAAHESASTTQQDRGEDNTHGERLQPSFSLPAVAHACRLSLLSPA